MAMEDTGVMVATDMAVTTVAMADTVTTVSARP